jgi:membrane protein insertase Oxa1/YidC/SpoIIIJ
MKTRLLFFGAILFLILGKNAHEGLLFYFFSIHLFTLFIGVFLHRREIKLSTRRNKETPPPAGSSKP